MLDTLAKLKRNSKDEISLGKWIVGSKKLVLYPITIMIRSDTLRHEVRLH